MQNFKKGFFFYLFAVLAVTMQFMGYMFHSQITGVMDFGGWAFYIASCISHAACLALPSFLLLAIACLLRIPRIGAALQVALTVILSCLIYVNEQVYQLYRFHINGFVLNMITGPAAGDIFSFSAALYAKYIFMFCIITAVYAAVWLFIDRGYRRVAWMAGMRRSALAVRLSVLLLVGSTLFAHIYHIFASFNEKQSVIVSERLLPYYFPTTSYGLLTETFGMVPPVHASSDIGSAEGDMMYPLNPIEVSDAGGTRPNIVLVLIDSWNPRALTSECMPCIYSYAQQNQWFRNHVSCSNGTRSSVFGIWFGLSSYYWNMAESNHITPLMLDVAREQGYTFRNYPAASQLDPPFGRVLFAKEKDVRIDTPGKGALECDSIITDDFIRDIENPDKRNEPFLSFLFYDAPHSFERPKGELAFTPSWEYADYSALNNSLDPTPFWNLYRNTCREADRQVGRLLRALDESGLADNTVVIISGDHSQEFNENKKNYWGHNGNFSWYQIGVPLIMHAPGMEPKEYRHRTTHYDIVPTLMRNVFNVTNPEEDYSMGHQLTDTASRTWHIVGSELNYAFIIEGDTILEKTPQGSLNVYDRHMNMVPGYHFNVAAFNKATERLNRFIKK